MNLTNVFHISQDEPAKAILGHPSTEVPITARSKSFYRLTTNRHGTYTIRLVVPLLLQPIFKCREIKKSLGTKDFKKARMLALHLSSQFDLLVNFNMKKHVTDFDLNNQILKELKVKFGGGEFEFNNLSDPAEQEAYKALLAMSSQQSGVTQPQAADSQIPLYQSKYLVSDVKNEYFTEIEKTLAPKTYSLYKREIGAYLDFAT
ncbi:MAG TPA: DUF6538 domain-containing protein, partial [Paraburkholderia sp.]|uniref:DUF6538 domain-containing protein n=1 Tax=Paraburkholderia sp. TaxID=1926495 RepID=UPI002DE5ECB3|nr:DUF6538 domain-containing protein [Paraburkholderia sp.]